MRAMCLRAAGDRLVMEERDDPVPDAHQILIKVSACGVCRTDLHVVDGDLPHIPYPIIPGHEIVGEVLSLGAGVSGFRVGQRVGVPWLGRTCERCWYCRHEMENLCETPGFTGYTLDGGYADRAVADSRYCFAIPDAYGDSEAAPLLCAGLIGYRCLKAAGVGRRLGLYGFGAAAHIVAQVAVAQGRDLYAFTRPGDTKAQDFARRMGANWAGGSDEPSPCLLDAAIIFAPHGSLLPTALRAVRKGGTVVCGGIHMSDIPSFPYDILWGERCVRSVANLSRQDAQEFLQLAPTIPVRTEIRTFPLEQANEALGCLRSGDLTGAAVLLP